MRGACSENKLKQGDQIGRILVYWANIFFGQLFENDRSSQIFWRFFIPRKKVCINFGTKNGVGNILGEFFTNSSGHPGQGVSGFLHFLSDGKKCFCLFKKKLTPKVSNY
jgi:hypothetical protein